MATGNYIRPFSAAQGALYYQTDVSSTDLSGSLIATITAADEQVIQCKDISVTFPKVESEQVALLGVETTTAGTGVLNSGTFQNAIQDFKNASNAQVTGTLILTLANDGSSATTPDFINLATGVGQAISTTHHRHTVGDSTSGQAQVLTGGIFLAFDNGVKAGVIAMIQPTVNIDEIKPTGSDGHWEVSFSANSLPKNWALEVEDSD